MIGIYLTGHPLDNYKLELEKYCQNKVADLKVLVAMRNGEAPPEIMERFAYLRKQGELSVGGLMANVQHKMTKTGKPFGTFVIEDYFDNYEFALFGDDYIKFRNLLGDGFFVQIKGNIEEKYRQKDNWDMRLGAINLLSEMRDKMTKSLTVCLHLHTLTDQLVNNLQTIIEANNQKYPVKNCTLRFMIKDSEDTLFTDMFSKTCKVNPSDDLMAEIYGLTNVQPVLK